MIRFYDNDVNLKSAKEYYNSIIPKINMDIFEHLENYKLNNSLKDDALYIKESYIDLVESVNKLDPELKKLFLLMEKYADTIDNKIFNQIDPFTILLRNYEQGSNSISSLSVASSYDMMINDSPLSASKINEILGMESPLDIILNEYIDFLTKEGLIKIHDKILEGTTKENKIGLRDNNEVYVGKLEKGIRLISYFPIKTDEIEEAINKFLKIYNTKKNSELDELTQPIMIHGLIALLQLFKDGNTRLGRLLQNVQMWAMFNNELVTPLEMPLIYANRQYAPYNGDYRYLIQNIAINDNIEDIDKWYNFNLRRLEDSINVTSMRLEKIKWLR